MGSASLSPVVTEAEGSGGCMKSKGGGFLSCELCLRPFSDCGDKILTHMHTHFEPVCLETSHRLTHMALPSGWESVKVLAVHSRPILCDPMDYSQPVSSVHGVLQARILEWVAFPFSKRSSWPRDWILVSRIAGRFFTVWSTREAPIRWEPPPPLTSCKSKLLGK